MHAAGSAPLVMRNARLQRIAQRKFIARVVLAAGLVLAIVATYGVDRSLEEIARKREVERQELDLGVARLGDDGVDDRLRLGLAAARQDHVRATPRQLERRHATDAGVGAGHHAHPPAHVGQVERGHAQPAAASSLGASSAPSPASGSAARLATGLPASTQPRMPGRMTATSRPASRARVAALSEAVHCVLPQ